MTICTSDSSSSSSIEPKRAWIVHGLLLGAAIGVAAGTHAAFALLRLRRTRSRVVGIIPARFASSRFEGKPLVHILGKPMIQRTWERAKLASTLDHVVVATDDERIADCCRGFGADVIMTAESCKNGTERCQEALTKLGKSYDIVVNIQGDEPLIEPEIIDGVVKALQSAPDAVFSTAVCSLKPDDALDPNRVKCVVNNQGYAIYFSRGLIPFNKSGKVNLKFPYLLHLGIQSFDTKFLSIYPELPSTPLQLEEDLEQLKVLENGYKLKVITAWADDTDIVIYGSAIEDLLFNGYIDGEIIDYCMKKWQIAYPKNMFVKTSTVHAVLLENKGVVKRFTANIIDFIKCEDAERVFFPICIGNHWTLLVFDLLEFYWTLYNSLRPIKFTEDQVLIKTVNKLKEFFWETLAKPFLELKRIKLTAETRSQLFISKKCAQQNPSSVDCALFVIEYMRDLADMNTVTITTDDIDFQEVRAELACEILSDTKFSWNLKKFVREGIKEFE